MLLTTNEQIIDIIRTNSDDPQIMRDIDNVMNDHLFDKNMRRAALYKIMKQAFYTEGA